MQRAVPSDASNPQYFFGDYGTNICSPQIEWKTLRIILHRHDFLDSLKDSSIQSLKKSRQAEKNTS